MVYKMVYKTLALLAAVALMSPPPAGQAQTRFNGLPTTHTGLAAAHVRALHGGFVRGPVSIRPSFRPHGPFVPPFVAISAFYAYGPSYPSCWTPLPTRAGWRRTWVCDWPYGRGYDYD